MIVDLVERKIQQFTNNKDHVEKHHTNIFIREKSIAESDFETRSSDCKKLNNSVEFIGYPFNDDNN